MHRVERRRLRSVVAAALVAAMGVVVAGAAATPPKQLRIVNGEPAPPGAYPFFTSIVAHDEPAEEGWYCGGALIAPRTVLTAAHCAIGSAPDEVDVVIGRYFLSGRDGERIRVNHIAVNPGYSDIEFNVGDFTHDSALLRLKHASSATPLQLIGANEGALWAPGTPARVIGHGSTNQRGVEYYDGLQQVDVNVVSDRQCREAYHHLKPGTILCAAAPNEDACYGDSGGPLMIADPAGAWREIGIVSSGRGCARPDYPGTYGEVASMLAFITNSHPTFAPYSVEPPNIAGNRHLGGTLTCKHGRWASNPAGYLYSWVLVRRPQTLGRTISADKRLEVTRSFVGRSVRCLVEGFNKGGTSQVQTHRVRLAG